MRHCQCHGRVPVQDGEDIVCDNCNGFIRHAMTTLSKPSYERPRLPSLTERVKQVWRWDGITAPCVEASDLKALTDTDERYTLPDGTRMREHSLTTHKRDGEITHWTHPMNNGMTATIFND